MQTSTPKKLRVGFETFGCRSNHADTVDLEAAVVSHGAIPCTIDSSPDIYVINTCAVTDGADREALKLIRRLKKKSPEAKVVVTGCLAEMSPEKVRLESGADIVIGPGQKESVLQAILGENPAPTRALSETRLPTWSSEDIDAPLAPDLSGPGQYLGEIRNRARFHLRIQEGCENSCTFCIIPQTRGRLSSRSIANILSDIRALEEKGYEEIVLTGTHIGGYGEDCGESFLRLLEAIEVQSPSARIRLSSIDPNELSPQIVDIVAGSNVFCPHLHICIQAFSDVILKRMNRRYRLEHVFQLMWYIREKLPKGAIGTDLITGFPGESREDVEQAMTTFLGLPFSYLHVFPYSERTGTAAPRLGGSVEVAERKRRAARWRAVGERKRIEFLRSLLSSEIEVVVEQKDETSLSGTSREFVTARCTQRHPRFSEIRLGNRVIARPISVDEEKGEIICV